MADNQNLQSMAENLFEAMDIITSKRLSALEYDKTLVCTIESVEDAKNGIYKVTDGVSHFTAYSENTEYKEKTKVYVKVPNGDMGNQKIITGKYISKEVEYISYTSPLNNFIDVTGNLIEINPSLSLQANNENKKTVTLWEIPERDNEGNVITPCSFKGYDRIGIRGDFKTYLDSYTRSGSYGLRLDIGERTEAGITKNHCFYLDSNDMYGNPYKYSTFFSQEQMYNISHIFEIISMRLVFYQKCDFFLEDGTLHSVVEGKDNIFVENPYISFGFDVSNFTEDTVIIGTNDSLTYSTEMRPSERKAYMRWVHLKEDKFYPIDESSEIPEGAIIHWYRYKIEQDRSDEIAGYFWKEFNPGEDKFNYVFTPDDTVADDMLKVIIEYPSREYITDSIYNSDTIKSLIKEIKRINTQFNENVLDGLFEYIDVDKINEEYFKAKTAAIDGVSGENISKVENALDEIYNTVLELRSSTKYYSSENLHFRNEIMMSDEAVDLVQSLSIQVDPDNQEGVYRLYDETNNIINSSEANKLRTLKAQYNSVVIDKKELDSAEEITWFIPINNTMIHEPIDGKEYNTEDGDIFINGDECEKVGYVAIKRLGEDTPDELTEGVHLIEIEQKFRIKDYYTQTASNNIIYCQVKKRGRIYEASAALLFGTSGTNGTEATFLLKMYDANGEDEVSALTIGNEVIIKPELYDFNNERLPINSIKYSWKEKNNSNIIKISLHDITCSLSIPSGTSINNCQFYILQASTKYSIITDIDENGNESIRDINLTAFLPIPVRISDEYVEIEGATKIVYDSNGSNPRYYKNPYRLYGARLKLFNTAKWKIYSADFDRLEDEEGNALTSAKRYYPVVQPTGEFMPTKMYYTGLSSVSVNAYINNNMVWTQPLLIIQNKYASAMLNDWNGNLTIDEKNGTILSAMMGAGIKNEDNSFSGIVMGDMGKVSDNFDPNNKTGIGLYGLDHGEQSYGFNVDGTAFIGKSGSGRINFDGTKGTITSANYEENKIGMQIDLDDPFLKAYGEAGSFELDLHAKDEEKNLGIDLLKINGILKDEYKPLLNIGAEKYFLQSIDFSEKDSTGLNFDLSNGKLTAYNFELYTANKIKDNLFSSVKLASSGNPYFKIHHASQNKYENVPVFKIYEPYLYHYLVIEDGKETYKIDESENYTEGRIYYNENNEALNIIDKNRVFGKYNNKFYTFDDTTNTEGYVVVKDYIDGIDYYDFKDNKYKKIKVINDAVGYISNKYYIKSEGNEYILDESDNYTAGRIYFDDEKKEIEVLDNKIYKNFTTEKKAGTLYISKESGYIIDSSPNYTNGRVYYKDDIGSIQAKVVPSNYTIFTSGKYYKKIIENGIETYVLEYNYYEYMVYYELISENNYKEILNMASPDSERYVPGKYYYYAEGTGWRKVRQDEAYSQNNVYSILENKKYNTSYIIIESENIYKKKTYFYIKGNKIDYEISEIFINGIQYYELKNGEYNPINVIKETDEIKIFRENTYYRYYFINGSFKEVNENSIYDPYETYFILLNSENIDEDKKIYQAVNVVDGKYEFPTNLDLYIYNSEEDTYYEASKDIFLCEQYYIISETELENNLINITKNKFELKSHDFNIYNKKGMHLDLSASAGYIEGFGEYINTKNEVIRPKFILDWRKNRNPIDINNGIFKVKWNGEVICTNIKAQGGSIGGWKIDENKIISGDIVLYSANATSAIYAGKNAKNIEDFIIEKIKIDSSKDETTDIERIDTDWNTLGIEDNKKYFYVDNDGTLEAYMAKIQYLKAKVLYVEDFYLGKKKVEWKSKKVVIGVKSNIEKVLTSVSASGSFPHQHKIISATDGSYTAGPKGGTDISIKINPKTTSVVKSSSSSSDKIIYLG